MNLNRIIPAEGWHTRYQTHPSPPVEEDDDLRAYVFAAGEFTSEGLHNLDIQPGDVIIAADGGAAHLEALGVAPNVVIGDFDSLSQQALAKLKKAGVEILSFPARKDHTDLELALLHVKDLGIAEVTIYGALGDRWDQTLANLLLPAAAQLEQLHIKLIDGQQEISLIRPQITHTVTGDPGDTVSLIPISVQVNGITTQGLEYALENGTLWLGSTRGVSNVLLNAEAAVTIQSGLLVCVVIHKNH